MSTIRDLLGSQDVHEGYASPHSIPQREGAAGASLPGRYLALGNKSGDSTPPAGDPNLDPPKVWLVNQLAKEQPSAITVHGLPGGRIGHEAEQGTTTLREGESLSPESAESIVLQSHVFQNLPQYAGLDVIHHTHGTMVPMAHENPAEHLSQALGRSINAPTHQHPQSCKTLPSVVDLPFQPQKIQAHSSSGTGDSNIRCQRERLGGSLPGSDSPGSLALPCSGDSLKYTGAPSGIPGPLSLCASSTGEERPNSVGQQGGGSLHPEARRYPKPHSSGRSSPHNGVVPDTSSGPESSLCPSSTEYASRLSEQRTSIQQRVVLESPGVRRSNGNLGGSGDRPGSNTSECQVFEIPFQGTLSNSGGDRLPPSPMGLQFGVHLPPNSSNSEVSISTPKVVGHSNHSGTILAEETVVYDAPTAQYPTSNPPSSYGGSPTPRSVSPSSPRQAPPDSLEVERARLREQGCSQAVITTLMQARKSSTNSIYTRIWEKFAQLAQLKGWNPVSPDPYQILEFLQTGIDKGLNSSTLKVQISALSAKTGTRWALHPLIIQFMKACVKIRPPRRPSFPSWDLSVVLEAFSNPPFFPLNSISLWDLTLKLSFLIAIASARRVSELQALMSKEPYLIVHPDRVILRPSDRFLPKVTSAFHYSQDIVLPCLSNENGEPHALDIKSTLSKYLSATTHLRSTDALLIIPHGARRGQAATSRTIASWLVRAIEKAYSTQQMEIPEGVRAHSTRAVATSWAAYCGVSAETICRAATWSSRHTFISHYRVDAALLATAEFGRSVIRANSSAL